jgi:hypothetical protein
LAVVIWWFLICFPRAQCPCTAPSAEQLKNVLWDRLRVIWANLPPEIKEQWVITSVKIENIVTKNSFAIARTARVENPDALQGFHSDNLLICCDEASGIADQIFMPVLGALTGKNNKIVLIGNPTKLTGFFSECFAPNSGWETLTLNAEESSLVEKDQISYWKSKYGDASDEYKVRVLGEFPSSDSSALFSVEDIDSAMTSNIIADDPVVWGVDVGGFGGDASVIAKREGNVIAEYKETFNRRSTQVAYWVQREYAITPERKKPVMIFVDVIGIGDGVFSRLQEIGLPVREVISHGKAFEPDKYANIRAEMYLRFRSALESRLVSLPNDHKLRGQLLTVGYTYDNKGRYQLLSKHGKGRFFGGKSPDIADAIAFTFTDNIYFYEKNNIYANSSFRRDNYLDENQETRWPDFS